MKEISEKSVAMYGVVPASKIIGETVVNRQSENVGKIDELVIDAKKNRIMYAVLSFGDFMGMGNKLFALPWEAFEFSAGDFQRMSETDSEVEKPVEPKPLSMERVRGFFADLGPGLITGAADDDPSGITKQMPLL